MMQCKKNQSGFTLLEIMLVLVIASTILMLFINFNIQTIDKQLRDKTVVQMQTILNAALAYYVNNGTWPTPACNGGDLAELNSSNALVSQKYLPDPATSASMRVPYWTPYNKYFIGVDSTTQMFYVYAFFGDTPSAKWVANARIVAGQLPNGITVRAGSSCVPQAQSIVAGSPAAVAASVPPPGQNLNNARSVNFGSLYQSGQCIPVPSCPTGMTAQVYAIPVEVRGSFDNDGSTTPAVYPISSYTAYAIPSDMACAEGVNDTCTHSGVTGGADNKYWRACLSVTTQKGKISPVTEQDTKNMGSILAITRCMPTNEQVGSPFGVYNVIY